MLWRLMGPTVCANFIFSLTSSQHESRILSALKYIARSTGTVSERDTVLSDDPVISYVCTLALSTFIF